MRQRRPGPHRERGVTFLGWLVLLLPIGIILYGCIRLTPVYMEYMAIARTFDNVSQEFKGEQADSRTIRTSIERHFDIDDVTSIDRNQVQIVKTGTGYTVRANYVRSVPFIANISLSAAFSKEAKIE
jgi:hypothetical protein